MTCLSYLSMYLPSFCSDHRKFNPSNKSISFNLCKVKEALLVLQQHNCLTIELPPEVDVEGMYVCVCVGGCVCLCACSSSCVCHAFPHIYVI